MRSNGIMEIRLVVNEKRRRCVVCSLHYQKDSNPVNSWRGTCWDEQNGGPTLTGLVLDWHNSRSA